MPAKRASAAYRPVSEPADGAQSYGMWPALGTAAFLLAVLYGVEGAAFGSPLRFLAATPSLQPSMAPAVSLPPPAWPIAPAAEQPGPPLPDEQLYPDESPLPDDSAFFDQLPPPGETDAAEYWNAAGAEPGEPELPSETLPDASLFPSETDAWVSGDVREEIAALRSELEQLRADVERLRRMFEGPGPPGTEDGSSDALQPPSAVEPLTPVIPAHRRAEGQPPPQLPVPPAAPLESPPHGAPDAVPVSAAEAPSGFWHWVRGFVGF